MIVWLSALLFVGCSGDGEDSAVEQPDSELPTGVHRLSGEDFDLPLSDLAPLTDMLADASVVGVGESIHFSGGFHRTRARVMKKLISEDDFRIVALEGSWQRAYTTRSYVDSCDSVDLDLAMAGTTFGAWQSQETAEFLQWLCGYNAQHPDDPVTFVGVDVQEPWTDMQLLHNLWPDEPTLDELSSCLGFALEPGQDPSSDPTIARLMTGTVGLEQAETDACLVGIDRVRTWVQSQSDPYVSILALTALQAGQTLYTPDQLSDPAIYEARDAGMADLLLLQREEIDPAARTLYWAHNAHILANGDQISDPFRSPPPQTAGTFLADRLGSDYAAIGFGAHTVSWDWPGLGADTVVSSEGSLEASLYALNEPFLLIDAELATGGDGVLAADEPVDFGNPNPNGMVIRDHYRALVYADVSDAMISWWQ